MYEVSLVFIRALKTSRDGIIHRRNVTIRTRATVHVNLTCRRPTNLLRLQEFVSDFAEMWYKLPECLLAA